MSTVVVVDRCVNKILFLMHCILLPAACGDSNVTNWLMYTYLHAYNVQHYVDISTHIQSRVIPRRSMAQ